MPYQFLTPEWMDASKAIREKQQTGQPVLVGTVSIEKSELLSDFLVKEGVGAGGRCQPLVISSVNGHQTSKIPTMTVVICMMRSALPLDSWMPLTLLHQK